MRSSLKRTPVRFLFHRLTAALAVLAFCSPAAVRADVTLHFAGQSNEPSVPASSLTADVTWSITGSQMSIKINDTSAYRIKELAFNTDTALTGLTYVSGAPGSVSVKGSGATQDKASGGFGKFNWLLDFGGAGDQLKSGKIYTLLFNMTGTTAEKTIATKTSTKGNVSAAHFTGIPGNTESAWATSAVAPEGASYSLLLAGLLPLGAVLARNQRKRNNPSS